MKIMRADQSTPKGKGFFTIQRYRPGLIFEDEAKEDWAFGPVALIDHARLRKGLVIKMHEHTNDEILSYMHKGGMLHEDSDGSEMFISRSKNMLMNAGSSFWHQESAPNEDIEMLQIIMRPSEADMEPQVQFADRTIEQNGEWNLIAGPADIDPPLVIRQQVSVFDAHCKDGEHLELPRIEGMTPWLFVMEGRVDVEGDELQKGDAISGEPDELTDVTFSEDGLIVLFLSDLNAEMTYKGNFSGPKNDDERRQNPTFM